MTMRQSVGGLATTASTAAAKLRLPALTRRARRPPNSGTVCASSTRRDGSDDQRIALDADQRERIVRVVDRGVDDLFGALAHQAGVAPHTSTIGRSGDGRATKESIFAVFSATMAG